METTLKTAPVKKPVSLDMVKRHVRIDVSDTDHDEILVELIGDATQYLESITWRRFITQTWYAYYDDWPKGDYIELPYGSLQSVTAIKYTDTDNAQSTWSSAEYIVGTDYTRGRVTLDDGYTWPNEVLYPSNPIEVEFVCGYGDDPTDIPANIKRAMCIYISELYENREASIVGTIHKKLDTINCLISNHRLNEL